jgi:hypothetical protein
VQWTATPIAVGDDLGDLIAQLGEGVIEPEHHIGGLMLFSVHFNWRTVG